MWYPQHIAPLADALIASSGDHGYRAGVTDLRAAMSAYRIWFSSDAERFAQALILGNANPNYRAGVAALAHSLGARRVSIMPGVGSLAQNMEATQ
jgi:hypothetical protein